MSANNPLPANAETGKANPLHKDRPINTAGNKRKAGESVNAAVIPGVDSIFSDLSHPFDLNSNDIGKNSNTWPEL